MRAFCRAEASREAVLEKTRFIASLAHDLRQPLLALTLFCESVTARIPAGESRSIAHALTRSAAELARSVEALVDISRLDYGTLFTLAIPRASVAGATKDSRPGQALDELARGRALREPVEAIRASAAALRARMRDAGSSTLLFGLMQCVQSIEELLDALAQSASQRSRPRVGAFEMDSLLERLRSQYGPAAAADLTDLRIMPCRASVRSDPALLLRVLGNLVGNAIRLARGGRVTVGCRRRGSIIQVCIHDNGPGIPPERIDEIFREFHQLGPDRHGGLGLGLSIVERNCALLGHEVRVRSAVGRGTTFTVDLPGADRGISGLPPASPSSARPSRTCPSPSSRSPSGTPARRSGA